MELLKILFRVLSSIQGLAWQPDSQANPESDEQQGQRKNYYSHARELLFREACDDRDALYTTYQRYYFAGEFTGYFAWIINAFTAIIGAILLYVVTGDALALWPTQQRPAQLEPILAILLLVASLLNAFYSPQARSIRYYKAGQDLHELHDEYVDFINLTLTNLDEDLEEHRNQYKDFHERRHRLNQAVPQLTGIWFKFIIVTRYIKRLIFGLRDKKNWLVRKTWQESLWTYRVVMLGKEPSQNYENTNEDIEKTELSLEVVGIAR